MGGAGRRIGAIVGGLITIVIGYALARVLLSSAATTGSDTNAPSFAGFQGISDLGPLVFIAAIILVGVGMIAAGGAGMLGRGPMGSHIAPLGVVGVVAAISATTPLGIIGLPLVGATGLVIYGAHAYQSFRQNRELQEAA